MALLVASAGDDPATAAANKRFIDAVAEAVRRHPTALGVGVSLEEADQAIAEARGGLFPQIDGGFEGRGGFTNRTSGIDGKDRKVDRVDTSRIDLVLTATQLLYDFGATFDAIAAAEHRAAAAAYQVQATRSALILRAVTAYHNVLRYRLLIQLAQENLREHETIQQKVRDRAGGGVGSESDVLRAESRVSDAQSRLIGLTGDYDAVVADYMEVFGEEPHAIELPALALGLPAAVNLAIDRATKKNPGLLRQSALTDAAGREAEAAEAANLPRMTLELSGTRFDALDGGPFAASDVMYDVGARVQFTYNFYSGGSATARERQAALRAGLARHELDTLRRDTERVVRASYAEIQARLERMRSIELALRADQSALHAYYQQFSIGRRDLVDLLDAQRDLFDSAVRLSDNRIDLELARYSVMALIGDLPRLFESSRAVEPDSEGEPKSVPLSTLGWLDGR